MILKFFDCNVLKFCSIKLNFGNQNTEFNCVWLNWFELRKEKYCLYKRKQKIEFFYDFSAICFLSRTKLAWTAGVSGIGVKTAVVGVAVGGDEGVSKIDSDFR